MRAVKVSVRKADQLVEIHWDDGHVQELSFNTLRRNCPCATCKELDVDRPLSPEALKLTALDPTGNYALQPTWADGHRDGIYTWSTLRGLATEKRVEGETRE